MTNSNIKDEIESYFMQTLEEKILYAGIFTITFSLLDWVQYWRVNGTPTTEIALQIGFIGMTTFALNCLFGSWLKKALTCVARKNSTTISVPVRDWTERINNPGDLLIERNQNSLVSSN